MTGLLVLIFGSCGTKKNTAMSRNWQAFTTRYNVYFNGKEHYNEQLAGMESDYEDDYTRRIFTHPAEARADDKMPQPKGDFKRTIEKMQKAIQLHSIKKKPVKRGSSKKEKEFRARDEFNPFLHNAWLTMGKGQYYNGDFPGAAATFMYISKHFTWLPNVVTEAKIWMALCYCALDWTYEAENALHPVKEKNLTTRELRDLYNLAKADLLIRSDRYKEALPFLTKAAKNAKGSQKNRLWFLLGQLYANLGDKKNAYMAYSNAGKGQGISYRAKFNARIKQSEVFTGKNISKEVNALKAMTRYARNQEFADQIYYAIGNLYLSSGDSVKAIENYGLAVEKSTRNGIDRALAQLALGNLYFAKGDYVKAQPCYSEAVPQLPENYPDYKMLKRRSDVLDELAVYSGNVQLQDSLLRLSEMTPEEQKAVAQRLVDELIAKEKKEAEEAKRLEAMQQREANTPQGIKKNDAAPQGFTANSDKSWYFYNAMTKSQGKSEFQRRWGARRLEDDWRRKNKATFSLDEPEENTSEESAENQEDPAKSDQEQDDNGEAKGKGKDSAADASDPHNIEYYLSQIPSTPEEKQNANDIIQEGLYNMGLILKDKLEDYAAAKTEFLRLETRYPDNVYRLDVYYNLYLMAVRLGDTAQAEEWRQKILSEFPDSPYGMAMRDPNYFDNLRRMNQVQEDMYEKAYQAYLADDNSTVHRLTEEMETDFPLSKILPKFVFIDALSYLTEPDNDKFKERISTLLERWPETDMTPIAANIMNGLRAGRVPHAGMSNTKGMIWSMNLTNDSVPLGDDGQPANFERDPNTPQYLVLAFPVDSVNANALLYEMARFNFSSFVVKDFDLEPMSFGEIGLLIVKGFNNLKELEHYRSVMTRNGLELPESVHPIMISKANFELLLREGRSFDDYFRFEAEPPAPADLPAPEPPDGFVPEDESAPDEATATEEDLTKQEKTETEEKAETEESEPGEAIPEEVDPPKTEPESAEPESTEPENTQNTPQEINDHVR